MPKGKYPFSKQLKYPHLRPEEVKIWERFIDKESQRFTSVDYDVHVGKAREYKEKPEDQYKKNLQELSRKRIDVLGYKAEEISIIELKPAADFEAFGQLIGYRDLYLRERPEIKKVSLILITDFEVPDMRELASDYGIEYVIV